MKLFIIIRDSKRIYYKITSIKLLFLILKILILNLENPKWPNQSYRPEFF
jgi:hypothetical protein